MNRNLDSLIDDGQKLHGQVEAQGVLVAGRDSEKQSVGRALELLKERDPARFRLVTSWIKRVGFLESKILESCFRNQFIHFGTGSILVRSKDEIDPSVLAAYLARYAALTEVFLRFKRREAFWGKLVLSYPMRMQMRTMRRLGCSEDWLGHLHDELTVVIKRREERRRRAWNRIPRGKGPISAFENV